MAALDRARRSIEQRWDQTRQALTSKLQVPADEIYSGNRTTKRVGATGGSVGRDRPKRVNRSIGEATARQLEVVDNDIDQLTNVITSIITQIRRIANRRGILLFQGDPTTNSENDPNDEANDGEDRAYQEFDNQLLYTGTRQADGKLYVHFEATETEPEVWVEVKTGNPTIFSPDPPPFPIPTENPPSDGDGWHDTTVDRLWLYDETDDIYRPTSTRNFVDFPPASDPDAYVDGDRLLVFIIPNGAVDQQPCEYMWTNDSWRLITCCSGNQCIPDPPTEQCDEGEVYNLNGIGEYFCSIPA